MAGIINGGFASGFGPVLADMGKQLVDYGSKQSLLKEEMDAREQMAMRLEDRTQKRNISDINSINNTAQNQLATDAMQNVPGGAGSSVSSEELQALKDNPPALAAYREAGAETLLNDDRASTLQAQAGAALKHGRPDLSKDLEAQATQLRADNKLEMQNQKIQNNFEVSMKKIDATNALAEKHSERGDTQSARAGLNNVLVDIGKQQDRLEVLMPTAEQPQKAIYENQLIRLDAERQSTRASLNKLAGVVGPEVPPSAKGAFDPNKYVVGATGGNTGAPAKPVPAVTQPAATPQVDPVAHLLDPHNVTPYEDKLKALMDMQPSRSAPTVEQEKWQTDFVRLKARQKSDTGIINRSM